MILEFQKPKKYEETFLFIISNSNTKEKN